MNELTIELVHDNGVHLYEQIYEYIKREIVEGRMKPNEKLPSTRALSLYLQISRSTVMLSYDQLFAEGYIEARQGSGYYVAEIDGVFRKTVDQEKNVTKELNRDAQKYTCVFSPTAVDLSEFPYPTWRKITKEVLNESEDELFSHGDFKGELNLRESIREYLHASRGVNCDLHQIIIGAGNDYLLMQLQILFSKQIGIAFEDPTYVKAYRNFQMMGYPVKTVKMDENGIHIQDLEESGASIAYVMPSHQYPTGIVMPIGRRIELLKWAAKQGDRYIIEDDYDSEFRYRGKPVPSLQSIDTLGKVIYIGTFSKAIAPAIRISYMVLPQRLLDIYQKEASFLSSTVPRMDQRVLYQFLKSGSFERYLNRMRKTYKQKHDLLLTKLRPFQRDFVISGEHAGLHILLQAKDNRSEKQLVELAAKQGVKVFGISEYEISKENKSHHATIILGYAGLSQEQILDGVEKLKLAWKNL